MGTGKRGEGGGSVQGRLSKGPLALSRCLAAPLPTPPPPSSLLLSVCLSRSPSSLAKYPYASAGPFGPHPPRRLPMAAFLTLQWLPLQPFFNGSLYNPSPTAAFITR